MKAIRQGMCVVVAVCAAAVGTLGQGLPAGWMDVPFGTYTAAWEGGSTYDSGADTFTVTGSGNDMWGMASDGGRFVFQPMLGDCEVMATVRRPFSSNLGYAARAGVLIRQRNDRGSQSMLFARRRGESATNLTTTLLVTATRRMLLGDAEARNLSGVEDEWIPLRLIRQGDVMRAFFSTNGVWEFYQTQTVPMGEAVNAGIFVSRHTSSSAQLMTNEFKQVVARQLVTAQTNASGGIDVAWVTDMPGLSNGWNYTYTLTRTADGGVSATLAQGLVAATYTDAAPVPGIAYRYAVTAVPVPQAGLDDPPDVAIGTSAATRLSASESNLVSGLPQGLFATYHSPIGATALVTRVETSVTNVVDNYPIGISNNFRTVFNASLRVDTTDTYTFFTDSDDAIRLWVGDTLVLDNWYGGRSKASSAPVRLEAGRVASFRAEYRQDTGSRACSLTWRRMGDPTEVPVPTEVLAPVPVLWRHSDVGDTMLNGNAQFDDVSGAITVTACGNTLDGAADACYMVWRDTADDFEIDARLDSLTGSGGQRAGIAVRASLASGAPALSLLATPVGGMYTVTALSRGATDTAPSAKAIATGVAVGAPLWLRLSRSGTALSVWFRADTAAEWTLAQTHVLPAGTLFAGLAVSSADGAASAQAVFGAVQNTILPGEALLPTHDAYMRANNTDTVNGTGTELLLKRTMANILTDDTYREGFMRFDVSGRKDVRSATLRLYLQSRDANPAVQEMMLRAFHDFHWSETTATWANAPGGLRLPTVFLTYDDTSVVGKTVIPAAGQYIEFDVSEVVRKAMRGTGDLTFNLSGMMAVVNSINLTTKESTVPERRPVLILRYDTPTGVTADAGPDSGSVMVAWNAFPGAVGYTVHRASTENGQFSPVGSTVNTFFKNTGLTSGQAAFYRVSATTIDGETAPSPTVRGVAAATAGTIIYTSGDTYVQGNGGNGQLADSNFCAATTMVIKYNANDKSFHREAYLLFNGIAELGHAERVVLRVTPQTSGPGNHAQTPVHFIRMPSNDWDESTATFNNYPPGYPPPTPILNGQSPKDRMVVPATVVNTVMEVDVTEMVREAARVNADGNLSIGVVRADSDGNFNLSLHSKEQTTDSRKPQLVYVLGQQPQPPAVADSGEHMVLTWPPYRGATGYVVRRAESQEGPYTVIGNTTGRSLKDMNAEAGMVYWYTLAAVTAGGETEESRPAPGCVDVSEERMPLADTMIENNGGATTDMNHGTVTAFNLKRSPIREDFFKFDVRGFTDVVRARFRVNASATSTIYGPVNIIVRYGDFGDWNETAVTYNEPPLGYRPPSVSTTAKGSNELGRILVPYRDAGGNRANWLEADVTEAVRQVARSGGRFLTLFLTGDDTLQHNEGVLSVASREHAVPQVRPVLLLSGRAFGTPHALTLDVEGDGFTLTWRPVTGAVRYIVTRQGPNDAAPVTLTTTETGTVFTDMGSAHWNERDYTYTVTAVHADGTVSDAASITRPLTRTFTRQVVADTFIQGGVNGNQANGVLPYVMLKGDSGTDLQREALFRIALDDVPAIMGAEFRMRLRTLNPGRDYGVVLREMPDSGWTEAGATWNGIFGTGYLRTSEPPPGDPAVAARFTIPTGIQPGDVMSFDITAQLKAAQARGAATLTLHMFVVGLGGENIFTIHSLQGAAHEYAPYVVYTVPRRPSPGALMLLK